MGYKLQDAVWDEDLGEREKLVLMAFARFADDRHGDDCYPSHETVRRMCGGLHLKALERAVQALAGAGYLKVVHRRYRDDSQRAAGAPFRRLYQVVLPGVIARPCPTGPGSCPKCRKLYASSHPTLMSGEGLGAHPTSVSGNGASRPDTLSVQTRHFERPDPTPENLDSIRDPSSDPSRSDPSTHTGVCDGDWEEEGEAERERYFLEEELRLYGVVGAERYATPALAAKARHTLNVVLDSPGVESVPALFASLMAQGGATETEAGAAKRAAARRERDPADRFFSGNYGRYVE